MALMASALILLTAGPATLAQNDAGSVYDPTVRRGSIFELFRAQPQRAVRPDPSERPTQRRAIDGPRLAQPAAAVIRPKVEPTHLIWVFGDTLADLVGGGLDDVLADVPTATVNRRTRADSGLVRSDFHDWPRAVREALAGDPKITAAVILVGANDRQPIREGDITHEPLSDRWRELYRDRIDAVIAAFAERRAPLVWVGAPPMQNPRLSADLIGINELYRQRVERAGQVFVDLWPAFVDAENRFSATGPDLSGQMARLRLGDGVHFTRAGARKAAHFVDQALRRIAPDLHVTPDLPAGTDPTLPPLIADAPPLPLELRPGGIERMIDEMARRGLGEEFGQIYRPTIVVKPVAGPVLPLTGPPSSAGGRLIADLATARTGPQSAPVESAFAQGRAPAPVQGRADDFRWPR
jgi:hypothetical protein